MPGLPGTGLADLRLGGRRVCRAQLHRLLIERRDDGSMRYTFSNLPANTSRFAAVRYWRSRWPVEQGYQQMKEELGLDHSEGPSWHRFHRHGVLVMLPYGFLTLERLRGSRPASKPPGLLPRLPNTLLRQCGLTRSVPRHLKGFAVAVLEMAHHNWIAGTV